MWKTIHMQMKILFSLENNAKMRIKMDKILEKWDEILSTVKHEHDISDISFDTWIRPLEVYGVEGNTLYILVPSEQMTLSYISKKYYLPLKVTIAELTGTEYEIQFILPEQTKNIRTGNNSVPKKNALSEKADRSNLNPNYTFDTFVVGPVGVTCRCRISGRSIQSTLYLWRTWTWKNSPYAFHRSFYIRKKPECKSTLRYIRGIYQRSN